MRAAFLTWNVNKCDPRDGRTVQRFVETMEMILGADGTGERIDVFCLGLQEAVQAEEWKKLLTRRLRLEDAGSCRMVESSGVVLIVALLSRQKQGVSFMQGQGATNVVTHRRGVLMDSFQRTKASVCMGLLVDGKVV